MPHNLDRVKRIWYLHVSPMWAAKVQASLRIRAVSPEPPLLAHTSSESRRTFRQKARSLASLNGWACTVKTCHDGMLEDTNSLDGAHLSQYFNGKRVVWTCSTMMFLSFRTDSSGQTDQTAPSLIRVYTVCNSLCIIWTHYTKVKPPCSNSSMITANFSGVRIYRIFTVVLYGRNTVVPL